MKKLLLLGTVLGAGMLPAQAFAQDAPAQAKAADTAKSAERPSNELIVTAQRREETTQEAAIPIVAATGEQLAQAGVADVTGLNKVAPSLNIVNQAGSATSFFIRGVGNYQNNNLSDSAVAFNFDCRVS